MGGDPRGEARRSIAQEGGRAKQIGENYRGTVLEPQLRQIRDFYMQAAPQQLEEYTNLQGQFGKLAETGGYTPEGAAALRSRALSPTRAIYANAQRNIDRQSALQGGYSPGRGILQARMAREQGQALGDASMGVEAQLAQQIAEGKRAGLAGAASLFGTTPGMSNMFGNQVLASTGLLGDQIGREYGLASSIMGHNVNAAQLPGRTQSILGNIGAGARIAAGIIPGLGGIDWGNIFNRGGGGGPTESIPGTPPPNVSFPPTNPIPGRPIPLPPGPPRNPPIPGPPGVPRGNIYPWQTF